LTAPKISVANQVFWVSPVTTDHLQSQFCFGNEEVIRIPFSKTSTKCASLINPIQNGKQPL
jgi:hypothetical protein